MRKTGTSERSVYNRRANMLLKVTGAVGTASLTLALAGCGNGVTNAEATRAAGNSTLGEGLFAGGYTLVDINGGTLQGRIDQAAFLAHQIPSAVFLGYRLCGNETAPTCAQQPLPEGQIEPVLAVWPNSNGKGYAVGFAGAVTTNEVVGIGKPSDATALTASAGIQRVEEDLRRASNPGSGDLLPNGDYAVNS